MIVDGDAGQTDAKRHRLLSLDTLMATGLSTVNRAIERNSFRPMDAAWAQARLCQFANLPCPARGESFGNACGSRWWSWRLPARGARLLA